LNTGISKTPLPSDVPPDPLKGESEAADDCPPFRGLGGSKKNGLPP